MELKLGQMGTYGNPVKGCFCYDCEKARAEQAKVKPVMSYQEYNTPTIGLDRDRFKPSNDWPVDWAKIVKESLNKVAPLPFEQPAPEPESVYTHVLLDFDEAGDEDGFKQHTAESLIEAIAARRTNADRYQVYRIVDSILDVDGA